MKFLARWVSLLVLGCVSIVCAVAVVVANSRAAERCEAICLPYAARITDSACYCARPDGTWGKKP